MLTLAAREPTKKFKFTPESRSVIYEILILDEELVGIENEKLCVSILSTRPDALSKLDKSDKPAISEMNRRKEIYQKVRSHLHTAAELASCTSSGPRAG